MEMSYRFYTFLTATFLLVVAVIQAEDFSNEELDKWTPPDWIIQNYRFYMTGFDDEKRPIWIGEWGKFDLRKVAEGGPESQQLFKKYLKKSERIVDKFIDVTENPSGQMNIILDFDGFTFDQFTSVPTVSYVLSLAREYRSYIEDGKINRVVIINANYVTEVLLRLGRGVFGRIFEVIDVYGTNKARWLPVLLRLFPRDQLPPQYGGEEGHKPVFEYKLGEKTAK